MRNLNVKLEDEYFNIIELVREGMGLRTTSDAVRHIIGLARVLYNDGLTISMAMKESFTEMLGDEKFRDNCILVDALKTIPALEKSLGLSNDIKKGD